MSDQDRISPYFINAISCRQVMRIKKILITRLLLLQLTVWQTVRRIINEILGVERLGGGRFQLKQGFKLTGLYSEVGCDRLKNNSTQNN